MSSPIERVVIIVKENHGFDTYFGRFPGADGDPGMAAAASPPDRDPSHTHSAWLKRATNAVREQYGQSDIPTYWDYAQQYTLCDRYFTDVAGPSTPNHLMLIAADSPWIENPPGGYRDAVKEQVDLPSLPAQLETAGLSWGNYGGYAFEYLKALAARQLPSSQFATDARSAKLPTVSWVYAPHPLSEHPPDTPKDRSAEVGNVADGMAWTAAQVDALVAGGLWDSTAVFITWDDWGGWADHVDPPSVESWSDGTQFRYGNRVPCLVLGAYAKAGYVSKVQHSHVSLIRFCEQTFGLPSLNARTEAADDMGDCFDFSRRLAPPQPAAAPPAPVAPAPAPQPAVSAQSALVAVREAATRASARIQAASTATAEAAVREQLRFAAQDVADISRLSGGA